MVPPSSDRISRVPPYLSQASVPHQGFRVRGYHPLRPPFPERSANADAKTRWLFPFRSPLLWESRLISVPPATEMFQFTGFALPTYVFSQRVTLAGRVSPFGHLRINAHLPAPRSFSQAATSFIACNRQGIHHMHLVA